MLTAGWTIYRDAVQRPKFRVSIAIKSVYQAGHEPIGPDVFVEALNLGPLANRLGVAWCRKSWWQRRVNPTESFAHIYSDYGHITATPSGERIEVGDTGTHVFPLIAAKVMARCRLWVSSSPTAAPSGWSAPVGEAEGKGQKAEVTAQKSVVGGGAVVPATWSQLPLIAKKRHAVMSSATARHSGRPALRRPSRICSTADLRAVTSAF